LGLILIHKMRFTQKLRIIFSLVLGFIAFAWFNLHSWHAATWKGVEKYIYA